jgi:hypothetical protein
MTVARLIAEGEKVLKTKFDARIGSVVYMGGRPTDVDIEKFAKWQATAKTCYGCSATQQSHGKKSLMATTSSRQHSAWWACFVALHD